MVRALRHRTWSPRIRRASATLGTWEWEGASFHTPLECGTKMPWCSWWCAQCRRTHTCWSTASKVSIAGFLLNPDETLSSTGYLVIPVKFTLCLLENTNIQGRGVGNVSSVWWVLKVQKKDLFLELLSCSEAAWIPAFLSWWTHIQHWHYWEESSASKYALFIGTESKPVAATSAIYGGKAVILFVQHFGDLVKSCHKNSPNFYFVSRDHFVARIPRHWRCNCTVFLGAAWGSITYGCV